MILLLNFKIIWGFRFSHSWSTWLAGSLFYGLNVYLIISILVSGCYTWPLRHDGNLKSNSQFEAVLKRAEAHDVTAIIYQEGNSDRIEYELWAEKGLPAAMKPVAIANKELRSFTSDKSIGY